MKHAIGLASALLLATGGAGWAQTATGPAHATSPAASATTGTAQRTASGMEDVRHSHGRLAAFPVHGRNARAELGDTKPGSTVRSAERNGAEPVGMTPPVPAPTVGATGGSVPYMR